MQTIKLGAVIYAPQVTVIWGIIADFFKENVYYSVSFFNKTYKQVFFENKIKETFHPIKFNWS